MRTPIDITENTTSLSSLDLRQITTQQRKFTMRTILQTFKGSGWVRRVLQGLSALYLLGVPTPSSAAYVCGCGPTAPGAGPSCVPFSGPTSFLNLVSCAYTNGPGSPTACPVRCAPSGACLSPAGPSPSPMFPSCEALYGNCLLSAMPGGLCPASPSSTPTLPPSATPTNLPSTTHPSLFPSRIPSTAPSLWPSPQPSQMPTGIPSLLPTLIPSMAPTDEPSSEPSNGSTADPSAQPSAQPSLEPSLEPSGKPSTVPSGLPTDMPTDAPTTPPSIEPTNEPSTLLPLRFPSRFPTRLPLFLRSTTAPTAAPSTELPSVEPSNPPTVDPSAAPSTPSSFLQSWWPSNSPSLEPTDAPTSLPSYVHTFTGSPTYDPSSLAIGSGAPANSPWDSPTVQGSVGAGGTVLLVATIVCFVGKKLGWWWGEDTKCRPCRKKSRKAAINDNEFNESLASSEPQSVRSVTYSSSQSRSGYNDEESGQSRFFMPSEIRGRMDESMSALPSQGPHSIAEDAAFSLQRRDPLANNEVELSVLAGADSQRSLPSRPPLQGSSLSPYFDEQ